jgi:hypothetical protein
MHMMVNIHSIQSAPRPPITMTPLSKISRSLIAQSRAKSSPTSSVLSLRSFSSAEPHIRDGIRDGNSGNITNSASLLPPVNPSKYWSIDPSTGRAQRPIFVAATKQHVGKTTVSLALMSGLQKRFNKVGFLKPVGQQHVEVQDASNQSLRVDKDVVLMREHFRLDHLDYRHMSPVIIPSGYTRRYVDGEIDFAAQVQHVHDAMEHVHANSNVVLIEGTGHCAVGSIVGLNNAKVASQLGADMVLM